MIITTTVTALPTPPNPATDDSNTFSAKASAFTQAMVTFGSQLNSFATDVNNTQTQMNASQTGSAVGITYTFSNLTTAADPGSGGLRLSNATENAATAMYVSNISSDGTDWSGVLGQFTSSSSTVKGFLKLHKAGDGTKWIAMTFTAMSSPTGYRNITLTVIASSSASPFANGDSVVLTFTRNGDAASGGSAAISDIVNQTQNSGTTGGTGTAYTLTPATAATSYAANMTYFVTFNTASGANPTLQISGIATPPSLVKQNADGSFSNIQAGDIPANHRSRVTGLSATQYLVEELPVPDGASTFAQSNFSADFTVGFGDRGKLYVHPNSDAATRTVTIPANGSVALPIGFTMTIVNESAGQVNVAITTDTLVMVGNGGTGSRSITGCGMATITKISATKWFISGGGLA